MRDENAIYIILKKIRARKEELKELEESLGREVRNEQGIQDQLPEDEEPDDDAEEERQQRISVAEYNRALALLEPRFR